MGVNFSTLVYLPCQDFFGRAVTITPLASQPAGGAYAARGIYDSGALTIQAEDQSIISDQRTVLDIRDVEFSTMPRQGDLIDIPADDMGPALGQFEIIDSSSNGGGETTLTLRKIEPAMP